jgi:hypothetical protein
MPRRSTATVDTPLTVKQTKFAADVANGETRTQARKNHYASSPEPKYAVANRRRASELGKQPNVAAEIRRLTWLACPPADDIRGMREHAIRVISDLSRSAKGEAVRLQAAMALYRIAETTRAASNPRASDAEQDRLLDALRGMYRTLQAQAGDIDLSPLGVPPTVDDEPIDIQAIGAPDDAE